MCPSDRVINAFGVLKTARRVALGCTRRVLCYYNQAWMVRSQTLFYLNPQLWFYKEGAHAVGRAALDFFSLLE